MHCEVIWHYAVSGDAVRLHREQVENAAAGYLDELAHPNLLQCPRLIERGNTSLKGSQNGGNLYGLQQ